MINHHYKFNVYNTDFSRKIISVNGWYIPSSFETVDAFSPNRMYVSLFDRFDIRKKLGIKIECSAYGANCIIHLLNALEEYSKYYDVSHYNLHKENERLRINIEELKIELSNLKSQSK